MGEECEDAGEEGKGKEQTKKQTKEQNKKPEEGKSKEQNKESTPAVQPGTSSPTVSFKLSKQSKVYDKLQCSIIKQHLCINTLCSHISSFTDQSDHGDW